MVRVNKRSASAIESEPASVEVPVLAAVEAAAEPAAKKPRAKKAAASAAAAVVEETPAPVVAAAAPSASADATEGDAEVAGATDAAAAKGGLASALVDELAEFNKTYQQWVQNSSLLRTNVKNITKLSLRLAKCAEKQMKKKKRSGDATQSVFQKPTGISDELAQFLQQENGSKLARTEVSSKIHTYVLENNLQDSKNRRIIHPDTKLKSLLGLDTASTDSLTYFNLQRYLKGHFKKEPKAAAATAAA